MDTLQAIKDYIATEQPLAIEKGKEHDLPPITYGNDYYRGYYSGYLTALYNIKLLIIKAENDTLPCKI